MTEPPTCYVKGCERPGLYSDRVTPWCCAIHYLHGSGTGQPAGILEFVKRGKA